MELKLRRRWGDNGAGGDPGTNAPGEGGTVRVRDFEG
jgi:hypothetical protein